MQTTNLLTNTSTLFAQFALSRTEANVNRSIRNLSSGVRINTPQDDPIGFVSATTFQNNISAMQQAVKGTQRASSLISVADSALSQLHAVLNDVRGFITQAASTGYENETTISALQTQLNDSLDAIDRIANSTMFLDKKILDGSLDFQTYGVDRKQVTSLTIQQANFMGRVEKDIAVKVVEPPRRAELYYQYGALANDVTFQVGGNEGYYVFDFAKEATVEMMAQSINTFTSTTGVVAEVRSGSTPGRIALTSPGLDNDIILTASQPGTQGGNFNIKYTAPPAGNSRLGINYTPALTDDEPNSIEVVLATSAWENAAYSYNDGTNRFSINSLVAGEAFDGMELNIVESASVGRAPGVESNLATNPKSLTLVVDATTTAADVAAWINADSKLRPYFGVTFESPPDGSGTVRTNGAFTQTARGVDGGKVTTTAAEIADLINTSPELRYPDGSGMLVASLPPLSIGAGIVSPFAEFSYYGTAADKNRLQFLAPTGTPPIHFSSEPSTKLGIDATTFPPTYGRSAANVQSLDPATSFTLRSRVPGTKYDGAGVVLQDAKTECAVFDPQQNAVVLSVDFAGRAASGTPFTLEDMRKLIDANPLVGNSFEFVPQQNYDRSNPPVFASNDYIGYSARVAEFSGGLVGAGKIVVHLETDANGIVQTTANDLVQFLANPPNAAAQELVARYGISASVLSEMNPVDTVCVTGTKATGTGRLKPTYDPASCPSDEVKQTQYPDVAFGAGTTRALATATPLAAGGIDSLFTVTARRFDTNLDGVEVLVSSDANGPRVSFDPVTRQLNIGVAGFVSANDVVALINNTQDVAALFSASIPQSVVGTTHVPTGNGPVTPGDRGVLRVTDETTTSGAPFVGATDSAGLGLIFRSVNEGSDAFVSVLALRNTEFNVVDRRGDSVERTSGSDVVADINGQRAVGRGHIASAQTTDLSLSIGIDSSLSAGSVFGFRISGGGALMQLGPDPQSSHQSRIALHDIHTAVLGSEAGKLSDLRLGGIADLFTNTRKGFEIIEDVISQVAFERGQLGAFQRNHLDVNSRHLTDAIGITEESLSNVLDTDFASATSLLTRNQVLMQANIAVLRYPTDNARMLVGLLQR
ncbi:MAG: flagellin [Thermoguttaceae bacterium]